MIMMPRFLFLALLLGVVSCNKAHAPNLNLPPDDGAVNFLRVSYSGSNPAFNALAMSPSAIENPILPGFYPDPSIVKTGDGYFLVNSTFSFYPGIPVFQSDDLIHWTQIGNVIDRPDMLDFSGLGMSRGVFAPTIEYHEGQYFVLTTCVDCEGNFIVTSDDPAGPWSDPIWLPEVGGIDPSIIFDGERAYIMNNDAPEGEPLYEGHRAIWIREVDPVTYQSISEPVVIINGGIDLSTKPVWIEGPHIYKRGDWFYLSAAEGGTSVNHSQVILRSRSITGPYEVGPNNPVLTQRDLPEDRPFPITSAGHADYVQDDDGQWWAVFLAVQPYEGNHYNTGRETFILPVDWSVEWPVILPPAQEIPRRIQVQATETAPDGHSASRLEWTEDFQNGVGLDWVSLRAPIADKLAIKDNGLWLTPQPISIDEIDAPTFIATRQRHSDAQMAVELDPSSLSTDVEAGLILFQNSQYWFSLLAEKGADGSLSLVLRQSVGGAEETILTSKLDSAELGQSLRLIANAQGRSYQFAYAHDDAPAQMMGGLLDGQILSTQTAGGFTGAVFGPYAAYQSDE